MMKKYRLSYWVWGKGLWKRESSLLDTEPKPGDEITLPSGVNLGTVILEVVEAEE